MEIYYSSHVLRDRSLRSVGASRALDYHVQMELGRDEAWRNGASSELQRGMRCRWGGGNCCIAEETVLRRGTAVSLRREREELGSMALTEYCCTQEGEGAKGGVVLLVLLQHMKETRTERGH